MTSTSPLSRLWRLLAARKWQLLSLFLSVLLPLLLFGVIAEDVLERQTFFFDDPLLLYAHGLASPPADAAMLQISRVGFGRGLVPLAIGLSLWLLARRRVRDFAFFGLSAGGAMLLNQTAKAVFGRQRPTLWESLAPESTLSFPSGHAMVSMATVAALAVLLWYTRWRYPMLIVGSLFVLLVGLSRVYLGVHYPSDILAGWFAAFAWVMGLSMVLYGRLGKPRLVHVPDQTRERG